MKKQCGAGVRKALVMITAAGAVSGCMSSLPGEPIIPALEYSQRMRGGQRDEYLRPSDPATRLERYRMRDSEYRSMAEKRRAEVRLVAAGGQPGDPSSDVVTNLSGEGKGEPEFQVYESSMPNTRDYNGPLSLGDPGVSASLWQESKREVDLFHDVRAFQAMDLVTIVVSENSEGKKEADTDLSTESTFNAALQNFLGFESDITKSNPNIDLSNLVNASTSTEFKGEGETNRKGSLKARISAMIVEVLPSGVLRVEGEKIISVNNEEQIMVLSGLVRTRDVTSENEIDSSKIANMRIDYFGRGSVGSTQVGGWLGNILRVIWPF